MEMLNSDWTIMPPPPWVICLVPVTTLSHSQLVWAFHVHRTLIPLIPPPPPPPHQNKRIMVTIWQRSGPVQSESSVRRQSPFNPCSSWKTLLALLQHPDNIANNPIALFKMAVIYFGTCFKGCSVPHSNNINNNKHDNAGGGSYIYLCPATYCRRPK